MSLTACAEGKGENPQPPAKGVNEIIIIIIIITLTTKLNE